MAWTVPTLVLNVLLAGMALALGFGSWETVLGLPWLGLDGLIWGPQPVLCSGKS